jgi:zinc transporter
VTLLGDGLIFAWRLDGHGGGRRLDGEALRSLADIEPPIWVHLDRDRSDTGAWLEEVAAIPRDIRDSLLIEDTRPRAEAIHDGLLINLRGVNLNPDAEPDDMLALRLWARTGLIVTLRRHRIMAAEDMANALAANRGPKDPGGLIAGLAMRLTDRMQPTVASLDAAVDSLEDETSQPDADAAALPELRKSAVALRRFIAPQQMALSRLATVSTAVLSEDDRVEIRHTLDIVTRLVEELDHLRERTNIIDDLIRQRQADQMARATYRLSLVATLFLPLGFLTGLLGINVGGIPGSDVDWAFWAVCALLTGLGLFGWWLLRRFRH